ncbi:MAG TPA: YceI family protein [Candidatus Angelobacter sp.]|jgi:polyisoprenoid-binding protein YceI|nr:YceI family protein [Candidatus Angelobacter sp.]
MFRFASVLITSLLLAISTSAQVETWQIDPAHSASQFAVRHMGISTVRGAFTKTSGTVQYDPADVSKTTIDVTIDTTSLNTRVEMRDNDLRSDKFFDVAKYPTITFKSKRAEAAGKGKMKITGDLTIHGVAKEVVLDVDGPAGPIKDPRGNTHIGASATTTISRKDFGVSALPAMIGDEVQITLDVEMVKKLP